MPAAPLCGGHGVAVLLGFDWWPSRRKSNSPSGVVPRAAVITPVKSSLGRAQLAARALPRHAGQVSTWAMGEHLLLLFATLNSLMTLASDHLVMIWCSKLPNLACDAATCCKLAMLIQLAVLLLDHVMMVCAKVLCQSVFS
jgi:hypothetical protein